MIHRVSDNLEFQAQALQLRAERQRLLASNIANADTPGYVARDLDFAGALRDAVSASGGVRGNPEVHLRYAAPSQTSVDGNTVDMDRERASFADNSVKYEATLRFINGHVRSLMDAMKSHHQT